MLLTFKIGLHPTGIAVGFLLVLSCYISGESCHCPKSVIGRFPWTLQRCAKYFGDLNLLDLFAVSSLLALASSSSICHIFCATLCVKTAVTLLAPSTGFCRHC
jgi:hypothetical protein